MVNKGTFTYEKIGSEYVIYYTEKGIKTYLNEYKFVRHEDLEEYMRNHMAELDACITRIKDAEKRRIAEKIALEEAKLRAKEAKKTEKTRKKEERKEKRRQFWAKWKRFFLGAISGFLAAVILLVGGHFAGKGIAGLIEKNDKKPGTSQDGTFEPTKEDPKLDNSNDIDHIIEKDEGLSQENFEALVAEFTKPYIDNGVNVTTEDLTKFVSIVNINVLAEENPEFAGELFSTQTKEVYLGDAANIIGMTYTYNRNVFEKEGSTENFIRLSNASYGSQKEVLQIIESYVDRIALVRENAEEVNKIIAELIVRLGDPDSDLSYVDDGTGFAMQVSIELIRSYFAKDVISQENFDMLTTLVPAEQYVSNIFVIYDKCTNTFSLVRKK